MVSWLLALTLVSQIDSQDQAQLDILAQIQAGQFQRVAVCPRPICRAGDAESFARSDVGPQGQKWCENLMEFLNASATNGGFTLVSQRSVRQALEGFTLDDLSDPAKLRQLGAHLQAQALVIVEVTNRDGGWHVQPHVIGLIDNTERSARREEVEISLSDYAFMGHSFEARRWGAERLELVGFHASMPRAEGLGMGLDYEIAQYSQLLPVATHPLAASDTPPYGMMILVNGVERPLTQIGSELYVQLDPGEQFAIRLWNQDKRPVLAGLYVDGVNTIGQEFEHPLETPPNRRWSLAPSYRGTVSGWYSVSTQNSQQTFERFRIVPKSDSVGFGESVDSHFGMITAIFYTNGTSGIEIPATELAKRGAAQGAFAVGRESAESIELLFHGAQAGLMLAAMTVHYRTGEELAALKSTLNGTNPVTNSSPPSDAGDKPPINYGGSTPKPVMPKPSPQHPPGEDEPFILKGKNVSGK